MRLIWASVLADLDLFRAESSVDFGTWCQLTDFDRLAMIPIWRQLGSRAEGVYAADRYGVYKRFGIEMQEWVERCGKCDFDALSLYQNQRTLARSISPRSFVIDQRSTRENAQIAERIRRQIDDAGITAPASLGGAELADGVAFVVDSMSVHLRVITCHTTVPLADDTALLVVITGNPTEKGLNPANLEDIKRIGAITSQVARLVPRPGPVAVGLPNHKYEITAVLPERESKSKSVFRMWRAGNATEYFRVRFSVRAGRELSASFVRDFRQFITLWQLHCQEWQYEKLPIGSVDFEDEGVDLLLTEAAQQCSVPWLELYARLHNAPSMTKYIAAIEFGVDRIERVAI